MSCLTWRLATSTRLERVLAGDVGGSQQFVGLAVPQAEEVGLVLAVLAAVSGDAEGQIAVGDLEEMRLQDAGIGFAVAVFAAPFPGPDFVAGGGVEVALFVGMGEVGNLPAAAAGYRPEGEISGFEVAVGQFLSPGDADSGEEQCRRGEERTPGTRAKKHDASPIPRFDCLQIPL